MHTITRYTRIRMAWSAHFAASVFAEHPSTSLVHDTYSSHARDFIWFR